MWAAPWANAFLANRDLGYANVAGGRGRAGPQSISAGRGARARRDALPCSAKRRHRRGVGQGDPAELGIIYIAAQTRPWIKARPVPLSNMPEFKDDENEMKKKLHECRVPERARARAK